MFLFLGDFFFGDRRESSGVRCSLELVVVRWSLKLESEVRASEWG